MIIWVKDVFNHFLFLYATDIIKISKAIDTELNSISDTFHFSQTLPLTLNRRRGGGAFGAPTYSFFALALSFVTLSP